MAQGTLTAHFGPELVSLLEGRFRAIWKRFDGARFREKVGPLEDLRLMARVERIGEALGAVLPEDPENAATVIERILPPPLGPKGKTFNDGYWVLPLAAYWPNNQIDAPSVALRSLREITQRGTAEFALRPFVERYPELLIEQIERWVADPSFHVRRLASEGTRPYLPWSGRLAVSREEGRRFFEIVRAMAWDESGYVRRSVGNHGRDWRRIDPTVVDHWLETQELPADVARLASQRRRGRRST